MFNPNIKFTVADYMTTSDFKRLHLLDGEILPVPTPPIRHQQVLGNLASLLFDFVESNHLGECFFGPLDVVLSNHDVVQPDILFVSSNRSGIVTKANIQGAPDLVVEILSPATVDWDRGYKLGLYAQRGVQEFWLVDPDANTVEVFTASASGFNHTSTYNKRHALTSPLLPGLCIELGKVLEDPAWMSQKFTGKGGCQNLAPDGECQSGSGFGATMPRFKLTVNSYMSNPDERPSQLLDGELIVAPAPTRRHQRLVRRLQRILDDFVLANQLGEVFQSPTDVVLSDHDVTQPDILFVGVDRSQISTPANIQGAPDLVVEVLSPITAEYDRGYKRTLYSRHGVQEYWLVDPNSNTIEVLTASETGLITAATYTQTGILTSPLLQGLSIDLEPIFAQ